MRNLLKIALLLFAPLAGAAELRDLRLWDGPDSTRVVFDLDAAAEHKVFTLANPDRVVIDISGIAQGGAAMVGKSAGKGVVQKLRSAAREDGSLRVVLDVAQPVQPKSFVIPPSDQYGYRLVLDLYGKQAKPDAAAAPTVRLAEKPIVVAIDAGHGGEDPGAQGRSGVQEKDIALSIARRLAKRVDEQPGMKAVLTRDGDYYIGLRERVEKARKAQADLFISVHCNAYTKRDMQGTAVYVLSPRGATNEHARWLAHQENSADMVGGIEIQDKDHELAAVLIDLSQSATMEASLDVGGRLLGALGHVNRLQKPRVQQAGFVVLKAPDIPSVLVETAFITNPHEERLLADSGYQERMAQSMLTGIKGYFQSYRPQQQVVENTPAAAPVAVDDRRGRTMQVSLERGAGAGQVAPGLSR